MFDLADKNFKWNTNIFKEWKENMLSMNEHTGFLNGKIEIVKKKRIKVEILEFKSTITEIKNIFWFVYKHIRYNKRENSLTKW